jgi:hypothetical protein
MPLLDHFHPPLTPVRAWESFHAMWATEVARTLNRRVLPKGYFAMDFPWLDGPAVWPWRRGRPR